MLKAKVHNAKVQDREGIKILLDLAPKHLPRLSHLWMDAGYTGEGKGEDWVERVLGWRAQIVRHPPKMAPEELSGPRRFGDLPSRWVVERTFSWLSKQTDEQGLRRVSGDERGVCLRSYDALDGETLGSLMRLLRHVSLPRRSVNKGKVEGPAS